MGLFSIKRKKPARVRTEADARARVEKMRRWVNGPVNRVMSWIVQSMFAIVGTFYLKVLNRTHIYGREILKQQQPPYLYVSNHLTMIDDFLLDPVLFGQWAITRFELKWYPWHVPEEKNFFLNPVVSWFLQKAQAVPITRGHGAFQPGMMRLRELLAGEAIVHIYPEGTRSRTGNINPGKAGTGKLAYETKCKVVPVYHEGTQSILPVGSNRLRVGKKVAICVGEPVPMDDLYAREESKATYQAIVDRMIDAIRDLRRDLHEKGNNVVEVREEWLRETSADDERRRTRRAARKKNEAAEDRESVDS